MMVDLDIRPGDALVYKNGVLCKAQKPEETQYIVGFYDKDDLIAVKEPTLSTSEPVPVLTQVLDWNALLKRKPDVEVTKKDVNGRVRFCLTGQPVTVSDLLPVFQIEEYSGDDREVSYVEVLYNSVSGMFDVLFAYAPEKISIGLIIK